MILLIPWLGGEPFPPAVDAVEVKTGHIEPAAAVMSARLRGRRRAVQCPGVVRENISEGTSAYGESRHNLEELRGRLEWAVGRGGRPP